MSSLLPSFRDKHMIQINSRFLITCNKYKILKDLEFWFRADWAPKMPPHWSISPNFFKSENAIEKCRTRFDSEIKKGRMLGGMGWSKKAVRDFLGNDFYVIPCGAIPKNGDPDGRIIHNYSFPSPDFGSVNSVLLDTSVSYISLKERVALLEKVDWYIKADLKNGYRQLPVHPSDWHTQVYCLGPNECYIDLCMPFGKANSSKVFCS